jgi:tetratricopeptide (TPR) repeat protein
MRLLHYNAPGRLILTDFRGKSIPPYAILSHRWSDSEILIEDISNDTYKEREEGYRKLQFCAERAAQDELQYFWIDTCCIDRWNNNERSKAINSMFRWYKNAARCYVFLSDVSVLTATELIQRSDWEASFHDSVWFTRGWTLQELIAPVSVDFFSCEGKRIGDKTSLDQLIHETTGIPLRALRSCPLDEFTTSERERWAKNRITTEEEDIVYCLLGILGVSMPTTYGEGQESARSRLQAELDGASDAASIIPFSRNPRFVGRESQLAELEAKLFTNERTTTTLAIVGPGGTGKSQLALEVAHRTRQNNKNCSVFWMDASDKDSLYQSYASVAQKLSVLGWDDDQADMKQLAKRCVVEMSARQCLLIFDNTEHTTLRSGGSFTTEAADLADYVPQSKLCSVIFTTTNTDTAQALACWNIIALRELTLDAALRMLQVRLARPLANTERQEAEHMLRELSYLPLAVVQAAACINASRITVQEYRLRLDEHIGFITELSSDSSENELQVPSVKDPVAASLSLSIDQISCDNAFATDSLFLAACVDRKDISIDLLGVSSTQAREDAISILDKYALITRRPAESALDVHRLVHQALRKCLQVQGQLQEWTQHTIRQLLRVFPNDDHSNRSKWRRLFPHAQYALSHSLADENNEERLRLASKCATTLLSDGRYEEAEELFNEVMDAKKRVLSDEHPDTLTSISNLASTYWNQGRWKEAEELQVQVIEMSKRMLSDEHPHTLTNIANLAATYRDQGRWKEAEELFNEVIKTSKRVLTDKHPDMLISMANLASTYWNQGRWKEAEELQVQVVDTRKRVLSDEHPDTLTSMVSLALTYTKQGRLKKAEELGMQVLQIRKRVLTDEHPDTLTSMANLALTYWNQGRWKEAEELEVQVMETRKRVLSDEHPYTLTSMNNLALTYWNQGRLKEAEELGMQVLQIRKRVLTDEHPDTLTSISNLALTYWNQGRWKEAEELELQVMQTRKRVLTDEHPDTLTSMHNFAFMLQSQAYHEEGLALMERCFQLREQVLGKQHPSTQSSLNTLSNWRA